MIAPCELMSRFVEHSPRRFGAVIDKTRVVELHTFNMLNGRSGYLKRVVGNDVEIDRWSLLDY